MKRLLVVLLIGIMVLATLSGCGENSNQTEVSQASLTLNIAQSGVGVKTIQPGLDMNIAAYDITGSGPSGTSFSKKNVTEATVTIYALAAGTWTLLVDGKNSGGTVIASGSSNIAISAGVANTGAVTVTPLSGTGTLRVTVAWPSGIISNPVVTGQLTPAGGSGSNISFAPAADQLSATYENAALNTGYYSLQVQVYDGAVLKWGGIEGVRIIKDQVSQGTLQLTSSPGQIGWLQLVITPDLQNPLSINFTGQESQLLMGKNMTVTATTDPNPVDSYQWYLNGICLPEETASAITIGSSLGEGSYRLDLVVRKGNIVSSGSIGFTVVNIPRVGLIGEWLFSGNANDTSGNSNNGIVNGATLTTDRFGNANNAYYFNGTYINCGNSPLWITNDQLAVSAWIKPLQANRRVMGRFDNDVKGGWYLFYNSEGKFQATIGTTDNHAYYTLTHSNGAAANIYHHVVLTYHKTTGELKLYVDGVGETMTGCFNGNFNYIAREWPSCLDFEIGSFWAGGQATFLGNIDDVRLYNRELSNFEVQALYHEPQLN